MNTFCHRVCYIYVLSRVVSCWQ